MALGGRDSSEGMNLRSFRSWSFSAVDYILAMPVMHYTISWRAFQGVQPMRFQHNSLMQNHPNTRNNARMHPPLHSLNPPPQPRNSFKKTYSSLSINPKHSNSVLTTLSNSPRSIPAVRARRYKLFTSVAMCCRIAICARSSASEIALARASNFSIEVVGLGLAEGEMGAGAGRGKLLC